MNVVNVDHIDVGANTTITKKERNIELVLVLDTTGSMGSGGKLTAMKSAAKQMVATLFNGKATSDTLKIGVVPFAAAVNIGTGNLNSGWLDKTAATTISYEDFKSGVKVLDFYSGGANALSNRSWAGCVRERGGAYELTDDAPTTHARRRCGRLILHLMSPTTARASPTTISAMAAIPAPPAIAAPPTATSASATPANTRARVFPAHRRGLTSTARRRRSRR